MYEKILAQLISKNSGVSKVVLGLIAKKLAEKVTEESQIEGAISDYETNSPVTIKEYADLLQSESDKRVTEALKKKVDAPKPDDEKKDVKTDDDIPAWAKGLVEQVSSLKTELAGNKTKSTLNDLVAKAKEKGIPEKYARKYQVGDEFSMETALTELEAEWSDIRQEAINTSVAGEKIVSGMKTTGKQVSNAIANFAKANVEASATKN